MEVNKTLERRRTDAVKKVKKYFGVELKLQKDDGTVSEENLKDAESKIKLVEFDNKGVRRDRQSRRRVIKIMLANGNN